MDRLSTLFRGLLAAALGTLAMDLVWFARYKRDGGQGSFLAWELASDLDSWDGAPAPARVGKLLYETLTRRELPPSQARLTTNVMHWAYGIQWGAVFAVGVDCPRRVRLWQGPMLGALVWLASYVAMPIAGFYKPLWQYDVGTLWKDLSAHLVYGLTLGAMFGQLARRRSERWAHGGP